MSLLTDILGAGAAAKNHEASHATIGGLIVPGSWSPADGTAQVLMLDTASILQDSGDLPVVILAEAATTQLGDQSGPLGNERVRLQRTDEGWSYTILHASDDAPGAPSGERWICHRNHSGTYDVLLKFTNDGAISGDGLGGLKVVAGSFASVSTTGGHSVVLSDHGKTITVTSAGGLTVTLNDNAGIISFCGGMGMSDGLVRQSDLVMLLSNIQTKLDTWASTSLQSGSGATGPTTLTSITPTASSKTFTA